jgi:hypothetical protein
MDRLARWASWGCAVHSSVTWAASAWACPSCPIGRLARQQVCEQGFTQNLVFSVAPFLVIGAAALWAERIGKH